MLGSPTWALTAAVLATADATRGASRSGAWTALAPAIGKLVQTGSLKDRSALVLPVAAVSVGVVCGEVVLDLPPIPTNRAVVPSLRRPITGPDRRRQPGRIRTNERVNPPSRGARRGTQPVHGTRWDSGPNLPITMGSAATPALDWRR